MSFAVKVDPEAEREWHDAVRWYGGGDPVAGHREIRVLAVWHGARNPDELRRRLK